MRLRHPSMFLACGALAAAGCGDGGGATATARSTPRLTETSCLTKAGFRLAGGAQDIAFFVQDRLAGKAEKPAGAFLHKLRVVAEEWQSVPESGQGPPRWVLWTAQPIAAGRPLSPEQLVARGGDRYYVAYIRGPNQRQLRAATNCLKRVQGDRG